jgi:hypothetical protein
MEGDIFEINSDGRLKLATCILQEGGDIERVCKALGWREFEDLTVLILDQNEFNTKKHFRFD